MPHLDDITGKLAGLLQLLRSRPRNTLDRLGVYEGRSIEELFPAPERVPSVQYRRRWRLPRMTSEDLAFNSLHQPLEPKFHDYYHTRRRRIQTVYARRLRPDASAGRPRLLYIHGYMQPETLIEEVLLLAGMAHGLNMELIQLQPPYHGRRTPRRSPYGGELYWTADVVRSLESLRQTLLDARTLLSILQTESDRPVGVSGISLGGSLTAVLTCLEPRFAFSSPFIAHMDMGALLRDAPVLGAMRKDLKRFGWSPRDFGAFFASIGWDGLLPVIPTDRILIFAATYDHFFQAEDVERMWRRWNQPEIRWYPNSHMGFIPHMASAVAQLRGFVDGLDLD